MKKVDKEEIKQLNQRRTEEDSRRTGKENMGNCIKQN